MAILDINKIISNLSTSSFIQPYADRFFESSLAFRKSHWENKFLDTNVQEGKSLVENNLNVYEEIPVNSIMVSLVHHQILTRVCVSKEKQMVVILILAMNYLALIPL